MGDTIWDEATRYWPNSDHVPTLDAWIRITTEYQLNLNDSAYNNTIKGRVQGGQLETPSSGVGRGGGGGQGGQLPPHFLDMFAP